jgi:hypothetical protein
MAASMKMAVFWVVAYCSLPCPVNIALMMAAASTSEIMLVNFYQTTQHNPDDSHVVRGGGGQCMCVFVRDVGS